MKGAKITLRIMDFMLFKKSEISSFSPEEQEIIKRNAVHKADGYIIPLHLPELKSEYVLKAAPISIRPQIFGMPS